MSIPSCAHVLRYEQVDSRCSCCILVHHVELSACSSIKPAKRCQKADCLQLEHHGRSKKLSHVLVSSFDFLDCPRLSTAGGSGATGREQFLRAALEEVSKTFFRIIRIRRPCLQTIRAARLAVFGEKNRHRSEVLRRSFDGALTRV